VPSAASAYSPIMGDKKFSEICYFLTLGVTAFLQQCILFIIICQHALKYSLTDYRAILGS